MHSFQSVIAHMASSGKLITFYPLPEPVMELLIRDGFPVPDELFPQLRIRDRVLREGAFDLGDRHVLTGGDHQEIGRIEFAQLDGQLFEFLDRVVIEFLGALADDGSRIGSAIGKNISNALSECDFLKEIVEPSASCRRASRESLFPSESRPPGARGQRR